MKSRSLNDGDNTESSTSATRRSNQKIDNCRIVIPSVGHEDEWRISYQNSLGMASSVAHLSVLRGTPSCREISRGNAKSEE